MFSILAQMGGDVATALSNAPTGASNMQYLLLTAIGGLSSVVGFLWLRLESSQNKMVAKMESQQVELLAALKECEDDRLKLWARVAAMEAK